MGKNLNFCSTPAADVRGHCLLIVSVELLQCGKFRAYKQLCMLCVGVIAPNRPFLGKSSKFKPESFATGGFAGAVLPALVCKGGVLYVFCTHRAEMCTAVLRVSIYVTDVQTFSSSMASREQCVSGLT